MPTQLSKKEFQLLQILWQKGRCVVEYNYVYKGPYIIDYQLSVATR